MPILFCSIAFIVFAIGPQTTSAQINFWERASGYFTDGDVTHLAINSSGHIFAGTNWGIYRSTNDGNTWSHLTDGIVFSLSVAPNGDVYTYYCITNQCGMHRSTDNGDTWTPINQAGFGDTVINAIAIRTSGNVFAGGKYRVHRSTNDGSSWTVSTVASGDENVTALGLASGLVFAGITDVALPTAYGTIRRSTDNGDTWTSFSPNWSNEKINGIVRNSLGYTFAATSAGIRRSTDFGATWTVTPLAGAPASAIAINSIGYLFAAAGNTSTQFVGAGIYRSTNRGDSWVQVNSGLTLTNALSVALNPNGDVYAGTAFTGVFRSVDTALTWTNANPSLYSSTVYSLAVPSNGLLYAGTIDGLFTSSDNGLRWWPRSNGLQLPYVRTIHENAEGILFAGLDGAGTARSTDQGLSWTPISSGIATQRVFSLTSKPGGLILAGAQSTVFRSTNNGDTWAPGGAGPASFVRSLLVTSSGNMFAGSGTGIHVSTDDGISWAPRNSGLTNTTVGALIRNQNGDMFAGTVGSVFRSTNNGLNWSAASGGFPSSFVNALMVGAGDSLFASTIDSGVYVSTNSGASWTAVNSGLPPFDSFFATQCFALSPNGYLFVGTTRAFDGIPAGVYRTHQQSSTTALQYSVTTGWNMISLPLIVSDDSVSAVFPTAVSDAFLFAGSYISQKRLSIGPGYWLKFGTSQTVSVTGIPKTSDTIAVVAGWNLIGSVSSFIDTAAVAEIPSGIIESAFYAFSAGYTPSATIEPGKAYWVKCSQPGVLVLTTASALLRGKNRFER